MTEQKQLPQLQRLHECEWTAARGGCLTRSTALEADTVRLCKSALGRELAKELRQIDTSRYEDPFGTLMDERRCNYYDIWLMEKLAGAEGDKREKIIRDVDNFLGFLLDAWLDAFNNGGQERFEAKTLDEYENGSPLNSKKLPTNKDGKLTRAQKLAEWTKLKLASEIERRKTPWAKLQPSIMINRNEQRLLEELVQIYRDAPGIIDELADARTELGGETTGGEGPLVRLARMYNDVAPANDQAAALEVQQAKENFAGLRRDWQDWEKQSADIVTAAMSMLDIERGRLAAGAFFKSAPKRLNGWKNT